MELGSFQGLSKFHFCNHHHLTGGEWRLREIGEFTPGHMRTRSGQPSYKSRTDWLQVHAANHDEKPPGQRAGAGRHAAHAGCARRLGAPGLRPLLLQVEGASHRPSLCLEWGVSAVLLHFLGLRRETLRTLGGPRRLWPRCRQAGAQPPVKAWLPRAGTTARGLCSSGPGQPPARGLLATSFGLEMCGTFRVDNRWQQTEQEKAFVTSSRQ